MALGNRKEKQGCEEGLMEEIHTTEGLAVRPWRREDNREEMAS